MQSKSLSFLQLAFKASFTSHLLGTGAPMKKIGDYNFSWQCEVRFQDHGAVVTAQSA